MIDDMVLVQVNVPGMALLKFDDAVILISHCVSSIGRE
jgi:hypothetical protein